MKLATGFTLVEIIIVVAITSTIFVIAADFLLLGLRTEDYVNEQNQAVVESRKAIGSIVGELREASPADTGAYPIESASEQEIIFFSDVDKDNTTERIRYFLDGANLKRGVIEPAGDPLTYDGANEVISTLSSYVRNETTPVFKYFNEDYPSDQVNNPLATPISTADVRMVQLFLEVNVDPTRVPETTELSVNIQLRNLKENFSL